MPEKDKSNDNMHTDAIVASLTNVVVRGIGMGEDEEYSSVKLSNQGFRAELKKLIREELVSEVSFDAITFIQGSNANFFAFRDQDLDTFAESFDSEPFLRDHETTVISSRDGIINRSVNMGGRFLQNISITTDEGIRDFAQGRIDRFSIGFDFTDIQCSLCDNLFFSPECSHLRGRTYEGLGTCNMLFLNPTGVETSAVNVPAVKGTHILSKIHDLEIKKAEVLNMDEELEDIQQGEQEDLESTLSVTQEESHDQDSTSEIAMLATALMLPEIVARLGVVESVLNEQQATISELQDQKAKLSHALAQLNGELPMSHAMNSNQVRPSWQGYTESVLNVVGRGNTTPEPKTDIRLPRALAESARESVENKMKAPSTAHKREVAGVSTMNYWNGGK